MWHTYINTDGKKPDSLSESKKPDSSTEGKKLGSSIESKKPDSGSESKKRDSSSEGKTPGTISKGVDLDFLTDANVYYNLPPPLPCAHSCWASLPRGHPPPQHHFRPYSSCPASPKLPPAVVPRRNISPRPPVAQERAGKDEVSPTLKPRAPKPTHKKLSHTRSFDLDHLYQNLVRVTSKPRSNSFSIDLPWRRKKKVQEATPDIKEDAGEENAARMLPAPHTPAEETFPKPSLLLTSSPRSIPETHSSQTTEISSSSSSSSSSSGDSSSGGVPGDCSAEVCPGVTYLRDTGPRNPPVNCVHEDAVNSWYHTAATLPLRASKCSTSEGSQHNFKPRQALDVNANLDEWLRKERWLEKKRSSRNLRLAGENVEVDITILHATDGDKWKRYLYDMFTLLAPKEDGYRGVRVEVKNVQDIKDDIGRLQAVKLKAAKLQIVILSPCFLDHIGKHVRCELGQVFKPEKVLALLLGVDDSQFTMAHRSVLYSYNDWHRLKVRNMDMSFIYEVLAEGISILNNSELFSHYQDERNAKFKVTPRKVNMVQQPLYIMMDEPVKNKKEVEVLIEDPPIHKCTTVKKWHLRNPYTIDFRMPEKFLKGSSLLLVTVLVNKKRIGSRQLKCESSMDTLKNILSTVSNPTDFMCQALNISPTSDELDQKLADTVKLHLPLQRVDEPNMQHKDGCEFPTWIHFSAYYGLERLTWALLEIPGGEAALNTPNCHGHTPSVLAYQMSFSFLAQTLEDAALVASLAAKVGYTTLKKRSVSLTESRLCEGMYNSPPPPRPCDLHHIFEYDPLPPPREVSTNKLADSGLKMESSEGLSLPPPPPPPPPLSPTLSDIQVREDHVCSPTLPPPPSPETLLHPPSPSTEQQIESEKIVYQDDEYIAMNGPEYSADVYNLVSAWMEKTNIKTFVEKNQDKIVEVKNKLDSNKVKDSGNEFTETETGEVSPSQSGTPEPNTSSTPGVARRKSVVEQFFNLLRRTSLDNVYSLPDTSDNHPQPKDSQTDEMACINETKRLPQPPPRPDPNSTYLELEDINTPMPFELKIQEKMVGLSSPSELTRSRLPTAAKKHSNISTTLSKHTKKSDEDELAYTTLS
nr:uncharacterized protein LOC123746107 isoform X2 [Procambarus clarkii]